MANQQELEELVVNMTGKANSYLEMLDKAQAKTGSAGQNISSSIEKTTTKVTTGLENIGKKTDATAANFNKLGKGLKDIGENAQKVGDALSKVTGDFTIASALAEWREADRAQKLLTASLEANGRQVQETMDRYIEFAEQIENSTTFAGTQVMEMFRLAESFDVTGDAAKRAVKNALALSEAHGINAESAVSATAALEKGSTRALSKYIPVLRKMGDETEKVAEAHRLLGKMYGQVEAATNTSGGAVKRLTNQWNNFKESVGETIERVLAPFISLFQELISVFQSLPSGVKATIAVVLTLTAILTTLSVVVGGGVIAWNALSASLGTYVTRATAATIASTALKGILITGVAYAAYEAGKALSGASEEYKKLDEAVEQSRKNNDKWAEKFQKNTSDIVESINKLNDPSQRESKLVTELRNAQNELSGYESGLKGAQRQAEEMNSRWKRWTGNKVLELANTQVDTYKGKLELARSRVEQLSGALNNIRNPESDKTLTGDLQKFTENLKLQSDTMGMTSEQIDIYKFSLRNASKEVLDLAKRQINLNDSLKGYNSIVERSRDITQQLKDELATLGMDPFEARNTLLLRQLATIRDAAPKNLDANSEEYKKLARVAMEAHQAIYQIRLAQNDLASNQRFNDLMKRGTDITQQYRSAVEVYSDTISELNMLLEAGAIEHDTYNRALEAAQKQWDDATKASDKYKKSLDSINAATFGSAEAISRIQQFNEEIRGQVMDVRSRAEMNVNKDDDEAAKKLDVTNDLLRRIEGKPAQILGIVNFNP